jgi:hypothetical protein
MSDLDDLFASLTMLTGMTRTEWEDTLNLPPPGQALALKTYQDINWQRDADTVQRIITIVETIGSIGGAVGSVAGAVAALRALL